MDNLTEGKYYYTDKGIEQAHYCEVNGRKMLVTPKGKPFAAVPDVKIISLLKVSRCKIKRLLNEHADLYKAYNDLDEYEFDKRLFMKNTKYICDLLSHIDNAISESEG